MIAVAVPLGLFIISSGAMSCDSNSGNEVRRSPAQREEAIREGAIRKLSEEFGVPMDEVRRGFDQAERRGR